MSAGAPNPYQWVPPRPLAPTRPDPPPRRGGGGWLAAAVSGVLVLVLAGVLVARLTTAANQQRAQATAAAAAGPPTATSDPNEQSAYSAALPGLACDNGTARWVDFWATEGCSPGATDLVANTEQRASSWYHGMDFYGNDLPFPEDYQLSVSVANIASGTCVGFWYRDVFLAVACQTGQSYIQSYSGDRQQWYGSVAPANGYSLRLIAIGPNYTLYVDGTAVVNGSDNSSLMTSHNIEITAIPSSSPDTDDLADFSNFSFTPLA